MHIIHLVNAPDDRGRKEGRHGGCRGAPRGHAPRVMPAHRATQPNEPDLTTQQAVRMSGIGASGPVQWLRSAAPETRGQCTWRDAIARPCKRPRGMTCISYVVCNMNRRARRTLPAPLPITRSASTSHADLAPMELGDRQCDSRRNRARQARLGRRALLTAWMKRLDFIIQLVNTRRCDRAPRPLRE